MPAQEVLILAMTHMRSGICTAGLTTERDEVTGLRWVRPVKEHGSLLLSDMTDQAGRVVKCGDVVALDLRSPRPQPPHSEDCIADFVYHRPRLLRRLAGERRARFLASYIDRAPQDVLVRCTRSLCLLKPDEVWASFRKDDYTGKFEARMGFRLNEVKEHAASSARGVPVTDLKWRALGRDWMANGQHELWLDRRETLLRLKAVELYLVLGLSRAYRDQFWPMVVGVHAVPDYSVVIDYGSL